MIVSRKNLLIVGMLALWACNKDGSIVSSDDSLIRYRAAEYVDLSEDVVVGMGRVYIDNASPYADILGDVMSNALEATLNGKPTRITNVEISDIKVVDVFMEIYSGEAPGFVEHLTRMDLVFEDQNGSVTPTVLATFSAVNASNGQLNFTWTGDDYTALFKDHSDYVLYFDYEFASPLSPDEPLNVKYELLLNYDYSYEEFEDK
jgi:hypothetical protein